MRVEIEQQKKQLDKWFVTHFTGVIFLNVILMLLVLLHSANYFEPYLPLNINLVMLIGMILARVLLKIQSRYLFAIAIVFLALSMILRLLNIEIWAERSMIYTFEALVIGTIILVLEAIV